MARCLALPLLFSLIFALPLFGQAETAHESQLQAIPGDWLIQAPDVQAEVYVSPDGKDLFLYNGLIRRRFRLQPNLACVAFDDLMSNRSLLRAVRPEGQLVLDGKSWNIGGLVGQPNHAYLTEAWLQTMTSDPDALQFLGYEVGEPKERFPWKRVRHHAPGAQWPPKGVHLRLDFGFPSGIGRQERALLESSDSRPLIWRDELQNLKAWKLHASTRMAGISIHNEGKPGEIKAPANVAVYAERPLPPETRLVEVKIHPGTDRSASWGPGLALVFADRVVKLNLRTGAGGPYDGSTGQFGDYGLWTGTGELLDQGRSNDSDRSLLAMDRPYRLRIRLEADGVYAEAAPEKEAWRTIFELAEASSWGPLQAVRVGKMDKEGGSRDFQEAGEWGRCLIESVAAYGELNEEELQRKRSAASSMQQAKVSVHYELYDGIPALSKWLEIHNGTQSVIEVDRFRCEWLAVVEHGSRVETRKGVVLPRPASLHVETNYAFGGFNHPEANRHAVFWKSDPEYLSQVNWARKTPCLLVVEPTLGPDFLLQPGEVFQSFRAFELVHDSTERERRGLALRRMYRTLAPWVTENPLILHVVSTKPETVKSAIDQAAECGFEMVSLSFGSGLSMENERPENLAKFRMLSDYALSKGIHLGGYSLLSSRRIRPDTDNCVNPETGKPGGQTHGFCPALASHWGQEYFRKLTKFFSETGFLQFTHDGSYPGDFDAASRPPLQRGLDDSQWVQWQIISRYYQWLRARGVYLRVPDYYYLQGGNECGMGYREVNWSLPRAQQVIHTRQNIYDGSWEKTPSMGWMFVPLTQYHGGGAAATIEPLDAHLDHYRRMLASNLGLGVQAVYRGFRLYDTPRVRDMVMEQVRWFKQHRDILESDLIHGRRADGRDWDWMLHVNPDLETPGMLVVYNPTQQIIQRSLEVDLYYTGLEDRVRYSIAGAAPVEARLDRRFRLKLPLRVEAEDWTWVQFEKVL
ncbi:MAG: hypothetical protein DWQ01_17480 [Planctomycetota bacterium]|nr:MAG: hypothetical protein DWQ01_17480 [Planctomycetota bacterium]